MFSIQILETETFSRWLRGVKDHRARARILSRIRRLSLGNPGDVTPVGKGVSEMRIHYGPGYRVYFVERGRSIAILLTGGDKQTQGKDILLAQELSEDF